MRSLLSAVFPLKQRSIISGIFYGLVVSLAVWLPLPANIQPGKSWLPLLYTAFAITLIVTLLRNKHYGMQDNPLGWKGLGFILAGIIFPLIPLGSDFTIRFEPHGLIYVGLTLIILNAILFVAK